MEEPIQPFRLLMVSNERFSRARRDHTKSRRSTGRKRGFTDDACLETAGVLVSAYSTECGECFNSDYGQGSRSIHCSG
jgi:hypothetical protein